MKIMLSAFTVEMFIRVFVRKFWLLFTGPKGRWSNRSLTLTLTLSLTLTLTAPNCYALVVDLSDQCPVPLGQVHIRTYQ